MTAPKKVTYRSIFSPDRNDDPVFMQRCAGFFVLHGINPALVPSTPVEVYKLGKGRARVDFTRVFPQGTPPKTWESLGNSIPDGYACGHGSGEDSHEASRWDSIEVSWSEVEA